MFSKIIDKLYVISLVLLMYLPNAFAIHIDEILTNKRIYTGDKVTITGIISKLKKEETKSYIKYKFNLISKFHKGYLKVEYSTTSFKKQVNNWPQCKNAQVAIVNGNFFSKLKGINAGDIKIIQTSPIYCFDDKDFLNIKNVLTIKDLAQNKSDYNNKLVKVKGYIKDLNIKKSSKYEKAYFTLMDQGYDGKLKVNLLISNNREKVNDFDCKHGQFLTISGAYIANLKSKYNLGKLSIISKEFIKCGDKKINLTKKEKEKEQKNLIRYNLKNLKLNFRRYKKITKSINNLKDTRLSKLNEEISQLIKSMAQTCKTYQTSNFRPLCANISFYVRMVEQRNQITFKINSAMNNMADWNDLKRYTIKNASTVLEIIKALYPVNSDYIIGIPSRCFPDQQFNPSASNFPYSQLEVSKYTKDNFTGILHKFNDPRLKCENLMGSIYFIGNMDNDPDFDVLKIDLRKPNLIHVIESDLL